ncbi:protein of unknown function [Bartonella clarridgeiae 73]|uniref:Uncharacterized protein n=1 Tax=Bartonella clarridgeiae (strain CCUG 45776 / CIP 104772 / 73) TaxID=696125 RepID=E6YIH6_BARC7|nr:protein of unknown function [Bartonella clarridgeiae 73]
MPAKTVIAKLSYKHYNFSYLRESTYEKYNTHIGVNDCISC